MGHRGPARLLPPAVAGYFFIRPAAEQSAPGAEPAVIGHRPLGVVRRDLLRLLDRAELTDEERSVIRLYHGLDGLPLPYASNSGADISGGRHESSPRATCRAGIAKIARDVDPRPLDAAPERPVVDPVREPWFRDRIAPDRRVDVVARAFVRAMSGCDGPYGPPTVAALTRWYSLCGYADPDLQRSTAPPTARATRARPNGNARNRAAALMEIALHEEVHALARPARYRVAVPAPHVASPDTCRLPETVTHPLLAALLNEKLSPDDLVDAGTVLQNLALNGTDVSGQTALFLRCVRPRLRHLDGHRLERLAVSISYIAATRGNPFLALEWLGAFVGRVGITDRTFTVLVNTIEAAAFGGFHGLAQRVDVLFTLLQHQWDIPPDQIPFVEHFEADQQHMAARAYRLEQLGRHQAACGDHRRAVTSYRQSISAALDAARKAEQVLADRRTFPAVELYGKEGLHGGDLTWPWALAALACIVEPLDRLQAEVADRPAEADLAADVVRPAAYARALLDDYEGPLDCARYRNWHERVDSVTSKVLVAL